MSHFASRIAIYLFIGYLFISLIVYSADRIFNKDGWDAGLYPYLIAVIIPWSPFIWIGSRLGFRESDLNWVEKSKLPLYVFCTAILVYLYGVLIHRIVAISPAGKYIS